jgi:hypothetical protein
MDEETYTNKEVLDKHGISRPNACIEEQEK